MSSMETRSHSGPSVVDLIKADHRMVEKLYSQYNSENNLKSKYQIAVEIVSALSQHAAQEEMTVYPYLKNHSGAMVGQVNHSIEEHQTVKEELARLEKLKITDAQFDAVLAATMADVAHHVKEEEEIVLPALQSVCSAAQLVKLGSDFLSAKKIAPTHPHPRAPNNGGVAEKIMNSAAKVVDDIRDSAHRASKSEHKSQKEQERKTVQ